MPRGVEGIRPPVGIRTMFVLVLIVLFSLALWQPRYAYSVPAFARKYQTSCQTCHVAIPYLTPFGEAFRLNGYRFPAGHDEEMTKVPPISLGAEGYKKLWPKSVWPGDIPGLPPVAIVVTSTVDYDHASRTTSFAGMGGETEIFGAGTLNEHFSFWTSIVAARNESGGIDLEMERVNLQARPLDTPALELKIGSFEPGLMLVSSHRSMLDQELLALTEPVGSNPWSAEGFQQGFEAFGILQHRVLYNAGLVEGSGSLSDNRKDVYGRLAYKVGGLPFDGVPSGGPDAALPTNPKPWSEKSVAVSGFGYHGNGVLAEPELAAMPLRIRSLPARAAQAIDLGSNDPFRVVGGDVAVNFLDLLAHGGYTDRKDDSQLLEGTPVSDLKIKNTFGELSWVAFPWLVPAGRWERLQVADDKFDQASFTVNGLVRANVKSFVAATWTKEPGGKFVNEGGSLGVMFGF